MPTLVKRGNQSWKVLGALMLAASLAVGAVILVSPRRKQAQQVAWRTMIVSASNEERGALLDQLSEREPHLAQELLVDLLGHHENEVVLAAKVALHKMVKGWRNGPPRSSALRIEGLAESLAACSGDLPPAGQEAAAALAREMLQWPINPENPSAVRILKHCESILLTTSLSPPSFDFSTANMAKLERLAVPPGRQVPGNPHAPLLPRASGEADSAVEAIMAPGPQTAEPFSNSISEEAPTSTPPDEFYSPLAIPLRRADRSPAINQ